MALREVGIVPDETLRKTMSDSWIVQERMNKDGG